MVDAEKPAGTEASEARAEPELITQETPGYRAARLASWLELTLWHRLKVEGKQRLPSEGPFLLVCNHASFLDIPVISACFMDRHVCFLARESLTGSRFMRWLLHTTGSVLIRRNSADRAALNEMIAHLKAGDPVCVYPEGTRTSDGKLGEFLPGALFAAKRARVPIVPVAIHGTFQALSRHHAFPRPARVRVTFGGGR